MATAELGVERADTFSEIYTQCKDRVFRYLYRISGDRMVADDLTQETFIRAYRAFNWYVSRTDDVGYMPWLYRIAHNLYANHIRTKRTSTDRNRFLPSEPNDMVLSYRVSVNLMNTYCAGLWQRFVEYLERNFNDPEDIARKQMIILMWLDGCPDVEIGERLGMSISAIKAAKHRLMTYMRHLAMNDEYPDDLVM